MAAPTFISTLDADQRKTLQSLAPHTALTKVVQKALDDWWKYWELEPLRAKAKRNTKSRNCEYSQPITGRVRRGFTYCQYLNYHFQPRCADAAKRSISRCVEVLADTQVRPCIFTHDELTFEGPEETVIEWTQIAHSAMVEGAKEILPDCDLGVGIDVCGVNWKKSGVGVEQWIKAKESAFAGEVS